MATTSAPAPRGSKTFTTSAYIYKTHNGFCHARCAPSRYASILCASNCNADSFLGRPIKGLPEEITVNPDESAEQIFSKIADAAKWSIHRLRITKGSDGSVITNDRSITVQQTGLRNKSAIVVKDLGMPRRIIRSDPLWPNFPNTDEANRSPDLLANRFHR